MVPGSSSASKASRNVASKVLSSAPQGALPTETRSKSGASPALHDQHPSVSSKGNEMSGKVDRVKEALTKQPAAPIKPRPLNSQCVSTRQASKESKLNSVQEVASQSITMAPLVGHSQAQEPPEDDADALTAFPPFAAGSKDKVRRFLESQELSEPDDTPQKNAINHSKTRPPTPWPGAAEDPELVQPVDNARSRVSSNQPPHRSPAEDKPSKVPSFKSAANTQPEDLGLKSLRISNPNMYSPLPAIPTSRFNFRSGDDIASIRDDTGLLTPITEVPSEISRASSPVDFTAKIASGELRPVNEQPRPPNKLPGPKPVEKPISQRSAPVEREVAKPDPPSSSTILPSLPSRPGTPQVPVGLSKPEKKPISSTSPQVRPDLSTGKRLEQKPSKLSISITSSTVEKDDQRRPETIPESLFPGPNFTTPQPRLSSPFHTSRDNKQAWDLETIASEDSWFQENEDSDGSASGDSGPRRTPPGQVRARLTVETVECTFRPPAQTPDLEQTQHDSVGQVRSEFFPPWAVGSEALSEVARGLKR
ncbi:Proteoglycan-4 [Aspergillus alliaceus]|uniref:Proteoglycan-4 n=1 Tax=Petromyces alliaceus TaxID=209559 RepID=A0A8H6E9D2_PETAA|nr:Proteoglycan-4 [Aspergillus burnettii]